MPERIQLSRAKGWRMPPNTVKVDRSTVLGNPFPGDVDPAAAVDRFEHWLNGRLSWAEFSQFATRVRVSGVADREAILRRLPALRGKNLGYWCKPGAPCHGEVLLRLANATAAEEPSCTG